MSTAENLFNKYSQRAENLFNSYSQKVENEGKKFEAHQLRNFDDFADSTKFRFLFLFSFFVFAFFFLTFSLFKVSQKIRTKLLKEFETMLTISWSTMSLLLAFF